jgi:RNA polymerase-binding transcription factor DksA
MTKELKLSDADAAKVKEKIDAMKAALDTWDKENADKLSAAQADMKKAREAKDKTAAKTAMEAMRTLTDARAKLKADKEGDLMSVLTADQKLAWEAYKLCYMVSETYRNAALTDDQLPQVKSLCADAAKQIVAAQDDAAKAQIRTNLLEDVKAKVLTDKQREGLTTTGGKEGKAAAGGGKRAGGKANKGL